MNTVEILPDIWISDSKIDTKLIKSCNINVVINVEDDLCFFGKCKTYLGQFQKSLMDQELNGLFKYFSQMTENIYKETQKGQIVLLMCRNGHSKSGLLMIAYLIRYAHLNIEDSINVINSKIHNKIELDKLELIGLTLFQNKIAEIVNQLN